MTRPRVLIFSLAYFPFVGGAEVAIREITDRLLEYDFDLITVNLDGRQKREEKIGKVVVHRLGHKYFFPFSAYRFAAKLHNQRNYNVIWAMMANQAGIAASRFKRRFPTIPFLLTLQEGDDLDSLAYRWRLLLPRLFGVFRLADYIQVISNYLGRWARKMGAKCPVTIVPNGVGLEKLKTGNQRPDLKEIPRSGLGQKTIITTSRLVKKNGVDTLIEAMRFLPDNVRLQILGAGLEEKSLKQLMSRVALDNRTRVALDNRIQFLGQVLPSKIPDYLIQADVFVRPSRSEGLGNSFLEAMAVGLPVVGTPVGGIPDFLFDSQGDTLAGFKVSPLHQTQTGWFCEVDNPKSIAEKVQYILDPNNRGKVDQVVANAKKLVEEKYDWGIIAQNMAQIMDNLVKKA